MFIVETEHSFQAPVGAPCVVQRHAAPMELTFLVRLFYKHAAPTALKSSEWIK
jgi:hypothetical protein